MIVKIFLKNENRRAPKTHWSSSADDGVIWRTIPYGIKKRPEALVAKIVLLGVDPPYRSVFLVHRNPYGSLALNTLMLFSMTHGCLLSFLIIIQKDI